MASQNQFPAGWNELRVKQVLNHYEGQTSDEAMAEDEADHDAHTSKSIRDSRNPKMLPDKLARLERVELRNVWIREAGDFTPWLAQDENIDLLGESIGLVLEVIAAEKSVGPFRADILCRVAGSDRFVIIENQLERTDHTHLGQLIAYAAGLDAATIVWVAQKFTEEHRAALDWLNRITGEDFSFFGLEVELWRIANSPAAPKFNIVSMPNGWTKPDSGARQKFDDDELTETKKLQLEYWSAFREHMESAGGAVRPTKPHPQHWQSFSIGRSGVWLDTVASMRDKWVGIHLIMGGIDAKAHFHLLQEKRPDFERAIGETLEWREMPTKKQSQVVLQRRGCDPANRADWRNQHEWLFNQMQAFHQAFSHAVRQLDASDYIADARP